MGNKIIYIDIGIKNLSSNNLFTEKMEWLSTGLGGAIVAPTTKNWLHIKKIGNFDYHSYLTFEKRFPGSTLFKCMQLFFKTLRILFKNKSINVIIAKTPLYTGIIAVILAKITGRKALIEVNGDFNVAFRYERPSGPTKNEIIKEKLSRYILQFSLSHASAIKLLYDTQIDCFRIKHLKQKRIEAFHDFVPISKISNLKSVDEKYILTLGYPWYLKGVDILIKAFKHIYNEFPEYKLKVHGWCPEEKDYFEKLAEGYDRIELNNPVEHAEALRLVSCCSIFVLASRTEGMGRVLLEAMASKKPVIGSNTSGIPAFVKHSINGLLFTSEDHIDLAEKMRSILKDKQLAEDLANGGFMYVHKKLSEVIYAEKYRNFVNSL